MGNLAICVSIHISLLSINQQGDKNMSESGGGTLKVSKLTKITYKNQKQFLHTFMAIPCNITINLWGGGGE